MTSGWAKAGSEDLLQEDGLNTTNRGQLPYQRSFSASSGGIPIVMAFSRSCQRRGLQYQKRLSGKMRRPQAEAIYL